MSEMKEEVDGPVVRLSGESGGQVRVREEMPIFHCKAEFVDYEGFISYVKLKPVILDSAKQLGVECSFQHLEPQSGLRTALPMGRQTGWRSTPTGVESVIMIFTGEHAGRIARAVQYLTKTR